MSYCIYLRKSRADLEAEARGEGETLARHKKILLELSKRLKINLTEIYHEIVSGETIASRPIMQQLLSEVEQGLWEGVLVIEIERLARGDTIDQGIVAQAFKFSKTKIITPVKTYDPNNEYDEEYFEFGLFMSRREYKTINRRLQNGRITSVKEGKYLGSKPPYGYNRKKLERQKGFTLEINQEQAEIVKLIFELYTKGESKSDGTSKRIGVSLIVRKLNELKTLPMNGDVWVPATIQSLLRNPVYVGKIRWNSRPSIKKMTNGQIRKERPRAKPEDWILVEGLHEPIIDHATWELAQMFLSENPTRPVPHNKKIENPLSGLIICGMCGRRMVRRPYGGRQAETLMCPITACKNVSSRLIDVETKLIQSLEIWLCNYKIVWENENIKQSKTQIDIKKNAIRKLDIELSNISKQMDNLHNLLEQGIYSIEKFLERSKILSDRAEEIQQNKNNFIEALEQNTKDEEIKKLIIPKIEKVLELYSASSSPAFKNELLSEVLEKVVYTKSKNGRWHNRPDDFELVLFPKYAK
jgi:DNA invertase Pin-like site-specific DNA recombinase